MFGIISRIDLTHGLRHQPLFCLLLGNAGMEFGKFGGIILNFSDLAVVQLPIVPIDIRPCCRRTDISARRIADGRPAQCIDRCFARRAEVFCCFV
jgi:hypothetical protein